MIPFINFKNNDNPECQFIHANGFPPFAYSSLLNLLSNNLHINAMLLRPHWEGDNGIEKLNNWNLFLEDFEKFGKFEKKSCIFEISRAKLLNTFENVETL